MSLPDIGFGSKTNHDQLGGATYPRYMVMYAERKETSDSTPNDEDPAFGFRGATTHTTGTDAKVYMGILNGVLPTPEHNITVSNLSAGIVGETDRVTAEPGLVFNPQASAPAVVEGMVYYDNVGKVLKYRDNTAWQTVGTSGLTPHVLDDETYHTATSLTVGWVISADSATTFSWKAPTGGMIAHDLTGAYHTEDATGGSGNVIVADSGTTFSWQQLDYTELASIPSTFDPVAHDLTSAYHTDSGLTGGHFLKADTTTTFSFQAHGLGASDVGAYTTAQVDSAIDTDISTHAGLPNAHHAQSHTLAGSDHTATGLTVGWVIAADSSTTFSWQAPSGGGPGSGTPWDLPVWDAAGTALTDSMISQDSGGTLATIGGNLDVSGTGSQKFHGDMLFYSSEGGKTDWRVTIKNADADALRIYGYDEGGTAFLDMIIGQSAALGLTVAGTTGNVTVGGELRADDGLGVGLAPTATRPFNVTRAGVQQIFLRSTDDQASIVVRGFTGYDAAIVFYEEANARGLVYYDASQNNCKFYSYGSTDNVALLDAGGITLTTGTSVTISTIPAGTSDYDKFLVSDTGIVKFRTGAEAYSDMDGYVTADFTTDFAAESLANLATRTHGSLSDAPTSAHHVRYADSEAIAAVVAEDPLTLTNDLTVSGGNLGIARVATSVGTLTPALEIYNRGAGVLGPHVHWYTSADSTHPRAQMYFDIADSMGLSFDAYFNGSNWISSDAGSSFQMYKLADELRFRYDTAAIGGTITWNNGIVLDASGNVTIGNTLTATTITAGGSDYDKFLVSDTGEIKFRTGAEAYADMDGYVDADTEAVITAELVDGQSIDLAIDSLILTHKNITGAHHTKWTTGDTEGVITAEIVDGQSIDNAIDSLIGTHAGDDDAHHAVFVLSDFTTAFAAESLANLTTRAHSDLSDAPTSSHHVRYADSEAIAAIVAENPLALTNAIKIGGDSIEDSTGAEMIGFTGAGYIDFFGGQGTPSNQDVLAWSTTNSRWEVQAQSGGGGITGSGTANVLTKWLVGGSTIQDSIISDDGSIATVTGALTVTGLTTVDGLVPEGDKVDALGSASLTWNDIFVVNIKDDDGTICAKTASDGKLYLNSGTGANEISIDDTLAGDSDDAVPTEQAVKAYIDRHSMIGEANSVWMPCIVNYIGVADGSVYVGHGTGAINIFTNVDGTDTPIMLTLPLPTNRGGLTLRVKGARAEIAAADAGDYLDRMRVYASRDDAFLNLLDDDNNKVGPGTWDYPFAAVDCGAYTQVIAYVECFLTQVADFSLRSILLDCYYA